MQIAIYIQILISDRSPINKPRIYGAIKARPGLLSVQSSNRSQMSLCELPKLGCHHLHKYWGRKGKVSVFYLFTFP